MRISYLSMFVVAIFIAGFILAGCAGAESVKKPISDGKSPSANAQKNCRMVNETVPKQNVVCEMVDETAENCRTGELKFESKRLDDIHICVDDGDCVGQLLSSCKTCAAANIRCGLDITNTDSAEGTWVVKALITQGKYAFDRNPVSLKIQPGQTGRFDFQQKYGYGTSDGVPMQATCATEIVAKGENKICRKTTVPKQVCRNETVNAVMSKEVCN